MHLDICLNVTAWCCQWVSYVMPFCDSGMLLVSSYEPSTWLCNLAMRFRSMPAIWPLLTIESPVAQPSVSPILSCVKVAHEAEPSMSLMFLPHFDVICDLLLNRRMATWNLFVKWLQKWHGSSLTWLTTNKLQIPIHSSKELITNIRNVSISVLLLWWFDLHQLHW